MKRRSKFLSSTVLFTLVLTLSFPGCGSSGVGGSGGEGDSELVRILHANPEFGAIDFEVEEQKRFNDVAYGNETGYFDVVEGKIKVAVKSETQVLPIVEEELTIAAGKDYSVLFLNVTEKPDLVLIEDDRLPPNDGQFKIRVGNLAESRASVDVYIVRDGERVDDQTPLASAVTYQSFGSYTGVDAGTYEIKFTKAGSKKVIRSSGLVDFQSGGVYTEYLIDDQGNRGPLSRLLIDAMY
jgi:hypothetical protein